MRALFRIGTLAAAILVLGSAAAQALITNTTIYNIRAGMHPIGSTDSLRINNVRVIGVDVRPTTFGVYVQEQAGGAFSGLLGYRGATPLAYQNSPDPITVGDIIDVVGRYAEFASGGGSLAELDFAIYFKDSSGSAPVPVVVSPCSLHTDNPNAERWEGRLVRVQNVVVRRVNSFNNWYFDLLGCGNVTPAHRDSVLSGYEKMISGQVVPQVGDTLASVTGVANWENSERRIAPRNSDDIIFLSPGPAPDPNLVYSSAENKIKVRFNVALNVASAQNVNNYALSTFETITSAVYNSPTRTVTLTTASNLVPDATTPHILTVQNVINDKNRIMAEPANETFIGGISTIAFIQTPVSAANDSSRVNNQQVSFRGVVTATGNGVEFPAGTGFYVQQRGATQFGGIFVFGAPSAPARNDSVFVSGVVSEFGIGPETEIVSVDEVTVLGGAAKSSPTYSIAAPPILPIQVTAADLYGPLNDPVAERYEGMLIRMNNVRVLTQAGTGNPFDVAATIGGPDTVRVDDLAIEESAYTPWRGDQLDVTGVIRFSGTVPYRRVQPRNWSEPPTGDIHVDSKANTSDTPVPVYRTHLAQNEPNPFNPRTAISYTIAKPGHVSLRVFNLNGRLVATLLDREVAAGPGSAIWNGFDNNGRRAPSGVYVYRLLSADGDLSRKMVLLK